MWICLLGNNFLQEIGLELFSLIVLCLLNALVSCHTNCWQVSAVVLFTPQPRLASRRTSQVDVPETFCCRLFGEGPLVVKARGLCDGWRVQLDVTRPSWSEGSCDVTMEPRTASLLILSTDLPGILW